MAYRRDDDSEGRGEREKSYILEELKKKKKKERKKNETICIAKSTNTKDLDSVMTKTSKTVKKVNHLI